MSIILPQVIDIASAAVLKTLPGDTEPVTAIAVHPSGTQAVVASRSNIVKLWNIESGRCLRTWQVCGCSPSRWRRIPLILPVIQYSIALQELLGTNPLHLYVLIYVVLCSLTAPQLRTWRSMHLEDSLQQHQQQGKCVCGMLTQGVARIASLHTKESCCAHCSTATTRPW